MNTGEIAIVARATDETAKIDLNAAGEVLLRGLFTSVGGADPDLALRLVDAVMDWRDADDLRRPNGAEAAELRELRAEVTRLRELHLMHCGMAACDDRDTTRDIP